MNILLPTESQVQSFSDKKCAISDYAIVLGGYVDNSSHIDNNSNLSGRTGYYYLITPDGSGDARVVGNYGSINSTTTTSRYVGVRPALSSSSINEIDSNEVRVVDDSTIIIGEYPQWVMSKEEQLNWNNLVNNNSLNITDKKYTIDTVKYDDYNTSFTKGELTEYEYNGVKAVRVKVNSYFDGQEFTLSNGENYKDGDYVWIKVSPLYFEKKGDFFYSKTIILAGLQFNNQNGIYNSESDFPNMDLSNYLNTYLKDEMLSSTIDNTYEQRDNLNSNPYNLSFDEMNEEDILKGALESDLSVFMHGLTGVGKSSRVEQLDKDFTKIDLSTTTLDGFIGLMIKDNDTNEMRYIEPYWYKELCEKCENEPDKNHILFIDELNNGAESLKKAAYDVVLEKRLINAGFKLDLPENSRVIAAGNEIEDSILASEMGAPLFGRFVHVYITTTSKEWLQWASENNIHPAIYAFIHYKGDQALYSKYDGIKPNATPRKWEFASKMLYKTNNPNMIRSLVGFEIANEFVSFCKTNVISMQDVISGNYSEQDLTMSSSQKYATTLNLSSVDEGNYEKVREFINNLDSEFQALFDMWYIQNGSDERILQVKEYKERNNVKRGMGI